MNNARMSGARRRPARAEAQSGRSKAFARVMAAVLPAAKWNACDVG
jgi:hypothetical protein